MINLKKIVIPTVEGIEVTNYDATADFTTDPIEFPNRAQDWSVDFQVAETEGVPADSFTISNAGANLTDGSYPGVEIEGGAIVDITVAGNIVTVATLVSGGSGYINGNTYSLVEYLPGTTPTQPVFTAVVTTNTDSTATISVCNTQDGVYKPWKTASTDMDLATITGVFDEIMPFRYIKVDYTANTSTGQISINVSK